MDKPSNTQDASGKVVKDPRLPWTWVPASTPSVCIICRFLAVSYPRDIIENLKKYGFPLGQGTALATLPEALATGSLMMKLGGS